MPDVHVPHVEKSFLKVAMEVELIATEPEIGPSKLGPYEIYFLVNCASLTTI
jgi:hypothetical protein